MYESYYGLRKKPFQITTDPSFLWMGKKHHQALTTLKYGVMDNKGFLLLTGDVGTGKTTLINRLVEDIQDKVYTAKIQDPGLSKYDFFRMVSRYFGLPIEVRTKSDFLEPFSRFLNDAHKERKSVLLLIDEAQRLRHDLMEEIRLLSNLERQDAKLLNIFFVGQNEFNSILLQPENRALMRRITITYNIDPLDLAETCDYIRHRLKTAGASYEIFSSAAMQEVYDFSSGFPRQINIICDLAMFFSSQVARRTISRKIVSQCRERISFTVDESPAKTESNVGMPTTAIRYRSPKNGNRSRFGAMRAIAVGVAAVLFGLSSGFYFAPDQLKDRVKLQIRETYRTYFPASGKAFGTTAPAMEMPESARADVETANPDTSPDALITPMTAHLQLDMPQSPVEVSFRGPAEDPSSRIEAPTQIATNKMPPAAPTTAVPNRPEPTDVIDWLLKKRQQEIGQ